MTEPLAIARHSPLRGRPPNKHPTEQIAVRLPKVMIDHFRKGRGVSKEIQERLLKSMADELLQEKMSR